MGIKVAFESVFDMIRQISFNSQIKSNRYFGEFFADRIVQAATESTLIDLAERLAKSVDVEISELYKPVITPFFQAASSEHANAILWWIRKHPKLAAMIALLNKEDYANAMNMIEIDPTISDKGEFSQAEYNFDIPLSVELLSPLAHGSDMKAGNATMFRRKQIVTSTGSIEEVPFYGGNALRGKMRDLLADDFLSLIGLLPRRDDPPVNLWFFHCIYSGGVLEEQSNNTKFLAQELGKNGAYRTEGVRKFREMLPFLSLLGTAIGNRVLQGRINVNDMIPRCKEYGTGNSIINELMEWSYLTRHDNHEGRSDDDAHTGMIANTECIKTGAILDGGIDITTHTREIEKAVLGRGLNLLKNNGMLGAENRRGLGKVAFSIENVPDEKPYLDYIEKNKSDILKYLNEIKAITVEETDLLEG